MRTQNLYLEDNSNEGRTLSIRYQLWDEDNRSQINKNGVQIYAVLKSPVEGTEQDLGECKLAELSEQSGIGDCELLLSASLFPSTGEENQTADVFIEARLKFQHALNAHAF